MIRLGRPEDAPRNLDIWRAAVVATHDFLSAEDRAEIEVLVAGWLPSAEPWVFVDETNQAIGFMALSGAHVDALFVDPKRHGNGVGRALVAHARMLHNDLTVDVNEQNSGAIGFYERLGFRRTGRSATDDQGRPYPLIHMALSR